MEIRGKQPNVALIELDFQTSYLNKVVKVYGENTSIMKKVKFSIPMHVL
jgi:hypothetical protein